MNFEDKNVTNYQALVLNQLYHFKEAQVKVTSEWLRNKTESVDFLSIMKGWWYEGQFKEKASPIEWRTYNFRKHNSDHIHFVGKNFQKKRCIKFSREMDSYYSPSHHTWINIELG